MTCRDLTCAVSLSPPQGLWPGVGEKVEVKKCLGDLGWQWCHGVCIATDAGQVMSDPYALFTPCAGGPKLEAHELGSQ